MTRRAPRRTLFGSLVLATALVATATPASASAVTYTAFERDLSVSVTDCPPAALAGVACRGFIIRASAGKSFETDVNTQFQVEGYSLVTQGGGAVSSAPVSASALTNGGKLVIGSNGKTASIDITADLVCYAPSCAISGLHRFKLSMSKQPASLVLVNTETSALDSPTCDRSTTESEILHRAFKGTGTVRAGSTTKTIRVFQPSSNTNGFEAETLVEKSLLPECAAPTFPAETTPWAKPLTGLPTGVGSPQAITVNQSTTGIAFQFFVHDCPPTSGFGAPCRVFPVRGEYSKEDLLVQQVFSADAYAATNRGGGEFDIDTLIARSATSSTGRINVAGTLKTGSLSMTVNFTCEIAGCAVSGAYTFKINFSKSIVSTIELQTATQSATQGDCAQAVREANGAHDKMKGTGSVKGNGSTRTLRISTVETGRVQISTRSRTSRTGSLCPDFTTVAAAPFTA